MNHEHLINSIRIYFLTHLGSVVRSAKDGYFKWNSKYLQSIKYKWISKAATWSEKNNKFDEVCRIFYSDSKKFQK